jgi:hypothetical protein
MMKIALFAVVLVLFFATGVITLLGIIQRVEIERKYLNGLFGALILELVAAVLFLFSATNFFDDEAPVAESETFALVQQYFPNQSLSEIKASLEMHDDLQAVVTELESDLSQKTDLLTELTFQRDSYETDLAARSDQLKLVNDELIARQAAVVRLEELERRFLVRMSELNRKISEWGTTVNFRWQPEEKRELAGMLQEAFKEIGFMGELEIPNDDPLLTHEVLVRYQQQKEFQKVGFLTHQTVGFIVQDYLQNSNSELR